MEKHGGEGQRWRLAHDDTDRGRMAQLDARGHTVTGRVERLSPLDAAFLTVEDHDPNASAAMGLLVVLEGAAPSDDELRTHIGARVGHVPRLRQVVRRSWWGVGGPRWVEQQPFDLSYHLRRAAVPSPHAEDTLGELVARLMESRLDRGRPLWELWVIEGLPGDGWALLIKGHHCLADGLAGLTVFRRLLADEPGPPEEHGDVDARDRGWSSVLQGLPRRLTQNVFAAQGIMSYVGDLLPLRVSGLAGPVGHARRFSSFDLSLDEVRATAHLHAASINEVVLAGVASGLRTALLRRGTDPRSVMVRTLVPVAVSYGGPHGLGNRLSMLLPRLPVDVEDPVARLRQTQLSVRRARAGHEVEAGAVVTAAAAGQPYRTTAWLVDLLTRLPQFNVAAVTTNVRGPAERLTVLGRRVVRMIPYVGLGMGLRLGVAVLSYDNRLTFGVSSSQDVPGELEAVVDGLRGTIAELGLVDSGDPGSGSPATEGLPE